MRDQPTVQPDPAPELTGHDVSLHQKYSMAFIFNVFSKARRNGSGSLGAERAAKTPSCVGGSEIFSGCAATQRRVSLSAV